MREQLRLVELSFNVRFNQARTSAVENTNRPLRRVASGNTGREI